MHKKLESDLISIAHRILKMKNKEDVFELRDVSKEVYEKLSILAFVEEYINTTPNLDKSKDELLSEVENGFINKEEATVLDELKEVETKNEVKIETEEKVIFNLIDENLDVEENISNLDLKDEVVEEELESKPEEVLEQPFDELENIMFSESKPNNFKDDVKDVADLKTSTLEEELKDTISVDVIADLFENVKPKSLNEKLSSNIQIGLNDRIVFVKNLFEGDQQNYNRVISQLNTFKTEKESMKFIKMVKSDYNWTEFEDLENRFMEIISKKFS